MKLGKQTWQFLFLDTRRHQGSPVDYSRSQERPSTPRTQTDSHAAAVEGARLKAAATGTSSANTGADPAERNT